METRDVRPLFVDTNVLIFATNLSSPWHKTAVDSLQRAREQGVEMVISPQVVREYLVAATRSANDGSLDWAEIWDNVLSFQSEFRIVEEDGAVVSTLVDLLRSVSVAGKQVHDANIVATMQVHGIRRLLTHNTADFVRFARVIDVVPLS